MSSPSSKDSRMRKNAVIKSLYDAILEDCIAEAVFKFHREQTILTSGAIIEEEDDNKKVPVSVVEQYDIFGHEAARNSKRSVECKCFVCHRMIAAVRFAPHLEKCIGIGRNSRVSRRRPAVAIQAETIKSTTTMTTRATSSGIAKATSTKVAVIQKQGANNGISESSGPKTRSGRRGNTRTTSGN
ncbi:sgf11 (transcriptional regulation protein) domain-containing protein [Ditylenchus destructor]|uniref:SAGA-associated factor 11 n=1 Tax=Ditylenchus destructor TaxID=166010 RepID=A0AAD4R0M7_9BILA|nr:sgf11 (transcriptional regulation protein) domain-containing protein [Ditylenchus destructor]